MEKKNYVSPAMADLSAYLDMPVLQTVPVSEGTTDTQLIKDREDISENPTDEKSDGNSYGNLW